MENAKEIDKAENLTYLGDDPHRARVRQVPNFRFFRKAKGPLS